MIEHRGYAAEVEADDDGTLHARWIGLHGVIGCDGADERALLAAFRESVEDYLALHAERGRPPERPQSGSPVV